MSIASELSSLQKDGLIDARFAVEWARKHPGSALHGALDWDDAHAAGEYRVWQVRRLIAIHIVDKDGERSVVSLTIDRSQGGYRPIADVLRKREWREVMLQDALAELKRVQTKYDRLTELARVWAEVRRIEVRTSQPKQKMRKAA